MKNNLWRLAIAAVIIGCLSCIFILLMLQHRQHRNVAGANDSWITIELNYLFDNGLLSHDTLQLNLDDERLFTCGLPADNFNTIIGLHVPQGNHHIIVRIPERKLSGETYTRVGKGGVQVYIQIEDMFGKEPTLQLQAKGIEGAVDRL